MTYGANAVTFPTMGLVRPDAEYMWRLPFEVSDAVEELSGDAYFNGADWSEFIVIPLYRDLIVPALPVTVEASYRESGSSRSPVAVTRIDGADTTMPWHTPQHLLDLLADDQYTVTLPVSFLAAALLGTASIRHLAGVPLASIEVALLAGLSAAEIRDQHANGTLDAVALSALAALRA